MRSLIASLFAIASSTTMAAVPAPELDPAPAAKGTQTAVFAGGCFWGVEAVFRHVKGVDRAVSGYAGGMAEHPQPNLIVVERPFEDPVPPDAPPLDLITIVNNYHGGDGSRPARI